MANKGIIAKLTNIQPIPGADRIVVADAAGYSVIVGVDEEENNLGVFFDSEVCLSEELCQVHDLVRRKDENGNQVGGYLEANRRIRCLKLKNTKSYGLWLPIEKLDYTGYDINLLKEGQQVDELNGHTLCFKYLTPATRSKRFGLQKVSRGETLMFKKHLETENLRHSLKTIPTNSVCFITLKVHGTSNRVGYVLDEAEIKRSKIGKWFANLIGLPTQKKEWTYLNGSRNVILEKNPDRKGFYGSDQFRYDAVKDIQLEKGECVFFEICGFIPETGTPIMSPQDTTKLKDKKLEKRFGSKMVYSYGCLPNTLRVFVYRITHTNEDGWVTELSWPLVVQRCKQLGLEPVKEIDRFVYDGDSEKLMKRISWMIDGNGTDAVSSMYDSSHLEEGIVLRTETERGVCFYKAKQFNFGLLEGYLKEDDKFVDTEESS